MLEALLSEENVNAAMFHLLSGKNRTDHTGLPLYQLPEYWQINRSVLISAIRKECYLPEVIMITNIAKKNGEPRAIGLLAHIDALLSRMLHQILLPKLLPGFSEACWAYMPEKSIADAVQKIISWIERGNSSCARLDIRNFFDEIDLERLLESLQRIIGRGPVHSLIRDLVYARRSEPPESGKLGLPQGSAISPILSNLYLSEFDHAWQECGMYLRYADDLLFFLPSMEQAEAVFMKASAMLADEYHLQINPEKSGVFDAPSETYFGYTLHRHYNRYQAKPSVGAAQRSSETWVSEPMKPLDKSLFLMAEGTLHKEDAALMFEGEDTRRRMPPEGLDTIHVMDRVFFSSVFFSYANQKRVRVSFYDRYGQFVGDFLPASLSAAPQALLKQANVSADENLRVRYAIPILRAAVHHMIYNLRHYASSGRALQSHIVELENAQASMEGCKTIGELMLLEARTRQVYFSAFPQIVTHERFRFTIRSRQPPLDAINALISFGNVCLYQRISTEISRAGLDGRLSFLHSPMMRRDSLSMDIAEIFKPLLVDRAIFCLINKNVLHADRHFSSRDDGGVYLNREGKRLFLTQLNQRLFTHVTVCKKHKMWLTIIRDEVYAIRRALVNDTPYKPYRHR